MGSIQSRLTSAGGPKAKKENKGVKTMQIARPFFSEGISLLTHHINMQGKT